MRRACPLNFRPLSRSWYTQASLETNAKAPLISIQDATFYRRQPSLPSEGGKDHDNRPLFANFNFILPAENVDKQHWAVVGPSNAGKTTMLEILRGQHLCFPPRARSYPYLSSDEIATKDFRLRYPEHAIQYVGFDNKQGGLNGLGTYMSARYESRQEITDFSLLDYLKGNTQLNAAQLQGEGVNRDILNQVVDDFNLKDLLSMPVGNLSNGQTRRAKIAKALLRRPELLLLDEPFMGLDPPTMVHLSSLLGRLAKTSSPRLMVAIRPQDPLPDWVTHILYLGKDLTVTHEGPKLDVEDLLYDELESFIKREKYQDTLSELPRYLSEFGRQLTDYGVSTNMASVTLSLRKRYRNARILYDAGDRSPTVIRNVMKGPRGHELGIKSVLYKGSTPDDAVMISEPIVEMSGVRVAYGGKAVLGNWYQKVSEEETKKMGLWWTVRRGERWAVVGPNGSGKTTLLSLITSDHPQTYSQPIRLFSRSRLPSPGQIGISLFDIQSRVGHSSPEVHAFFPRSLTIRQTLESAYAETPLGPPKALDAVGDNRIDACLRWFQGDLNPALGMNSVLKSELLHRRTIRLDASISKLPTDRDKYRDVIKEHFYTLDTQQAELLQWADSMTFGELPFSAQRLALFLRAIVASPDLIILDEAFSGMDDTLRDKCLLFLEAGESKRTTLFHSTGGFYKFGPAVKTRGAKETRVRAHIRFGLNTNNEDNDVAGGSGITIKEGLTARQALIVVSHLKEEIPLSVKDWMYLPQPGQGPCRIGKVGEVPLRLDDELWNSIWRSERERVLGESVDFDALEKRTTGRRSKRKNERKSDAAS